MNIIHETGPGGKGGRSSRALAISSLLDIRGLTALDLGSKEGYNSFDLYECGAKKVVGLEVRESFLNEANKSLHELGYSNSVEFKQADIRFVDEMGLGNFDLCLCSGLLYHMQNPFNLLKRIRNTTRYLALETHIAPSYLNYLRAAEKYRAHLEFRQRNVMLDGYSFRGRLNIFPPEQDMQKTSGSVVSRATFWLNKSSLIQALDLAGFKINATYFESIPKGKQKILIDHGIKRTKVFIFAEVKNPGVHIPAGASKIEGCSHLII